MKMNRFINQNVIITGGSSGIGSTITSRLLSEGANVIIWDILSPKEKMNEENKFFVEVDIRNWEKIKEALKISKKIISDNASSYTILNFGWLYFLGGNKCEIR